MGNLGGVVAARCCTEVAPADASAPATKQILAITPIVFFEMFVIDFII